MNEWKVVFQKSKISYFPSKMLKQQLIGKMTLKMSQVCLYFLINYFLSKSFFVWLKNDAKVKYLQYLCGICCCLVNLVNSQRSTHCWLDNFVFSRIFLLISHVRFGGPQNKFSLSLGWMGRRLRARVVINSWKISI